jgi:hypothetical protein
LAQVPQALRIESLLYLVIGSPAFNHREVRRRDAGGAGGASPSLRWAYLLTRRLGPDIQLKIVTRTPDAEMSGGL